jgi:signal transduction histidine kinase
VFAALDATILRTVALLVAGLLFSALAALSLARSMARPISTLQQGAARIGAGDLEQKIDIRTGDELESLADEFNRMSARLRESYAGLERKVEERTAELQQSLEFQKATGDILTSISGSITDTQPVFEAIVQSMRRLFGTRSALVALLQDGQFHLKAVGASDAAYNERMRAAFPRSADEEESLGARALRSGKVLQLCPVIDNPEAPARTVALARQNGFNAILMAPMLREGKPLGYIATSRAEPIAFDEKQVALIKAFADQAVIAIENARLVNETKEALEQQTATAEILKVISSSTTDTQPVFEAIVQSGLKLFPDAAVAVVLPDGDEVRMAAVANKDATLADAMLSRFPIPLAREYMHGTAILDRRVVDVPDGERLGDASLAPGVRNFLASGARAITIMPMLRGDTAIGAISVTRLKPGPLSDKQIALLRTFADQAVIAIENVRLFNETKEALEQQTATADILKVISSSTTDTQPVFDAIVQSAAQLFAPCSAGIVMREGAMLQLRAAAGSNVDQKVREDLAELYPMPFDPETILTARSIETREVIAMDDAQAPSVHERLRSASQAGRFRSITIVPLVRDEDGIGAIGLSHPEPGHTLSEKQIALLRTFADQAVIAIENVRLFNETKEALEQQTATAEVLNVISGSITDARPVFDAISRSVLNLFGGRTVGLYVRVGERIDRVGYALADKTADDGTGALWPMPLDDKSLTGRAILAGDLVHIKDVEREPGLSDQSRTITSRSGVRSVLIAPMQSMGTTTGALSVGRRAPGGFSDREVELLATFADQAVIAMENVRLFNEIEEKSRQLEIANKHKSDFLANMSHELRTPLNAIIGFSEVLMERMFGEVNEKQADYLKDIHESGKHLLSLINDILDLSKIEAGRMDLEIAAFDLPSALSNAMTLVRERAQRHGIALGLDVDKRLGEFRADERKFKQIVLNLLSNAVKFTPDGGRVEVRARLDTGQVEIAVKDTGIGIAPEDQAAVFEEFKQVGRDARRKAEGTGLGLALTKRFVELHGGSIGLESAPGKGSTFTIKLPVRT